ncbi:MAG: NrfD/PsrC family molybdoenzyme membrane anchor subunit [Pararhizobium sp.]
MTMAAATGGTLPAHDREKGREALLYVDSNEAINTLVSGPLLDKTSWRRWWIAFGVSMIFTLIFFGSAVYLFTKGIGIFGNNSTVVWGYPIANYVWWIGIGNAGTLISSMLLLTHQKWRAAINRFAEAMTLMAVAIAGIMPIMHMGRPLYFYWLFPYPNVQSLWPQWRSALIWDFWAILSYLLFSIIFWYTGLIPDLATLRDRASTRGKQVFYGILALGWRNSARHWHVYETYYFTMAALATPLVCSVHSIVGLDFAASLMPGWQEPIFPPYFVVGAMYSGFAMVVLLAAFVRWGLRLEAVITIRHFDVMAKVMLFAAIVMFLSYASEWFSGWYSGRDADREFLTYEFTGTYSWLYWIMIFCNCFAAQAFWVPAVRKSVVAVVFIGILINIGMWLERILIVWNTLARAYEPSMWHIFIPTLWDWLVLFGSLGFFATMYLLFVRVFPAVSMHEVRQLADQERP